MFGSNEFEEDDFFNDNEEYFKKDGFFTKIIKKLFNLIALF